MAETDHVAAERRKHRRDAAMWILGIPIFLLAIVVLMPSADRRPVTYDPPETSFAGRVTALVDICVRTRAYGQWDGALARSRPSLEQYCRQTALEVVLEQIEKERGEPAAD
ncbi:hypothetical protein [Parvibaculum sp.]|uniref:hypothetical protein n=1 Tax=Parvibaculum sp. TaxID=2024848 RepID=UPI00391D59E5